MNFVRQGETVTLVKDVPYTDGTALVESDYSLIIIHNSAEKYMSPPDITFTIVQPTQTQDGTISVSILAEANWEDGLYVFSLRKTSVTEPSTWWTTPIGSASVFVQKVVSEVKL